MCRWWRSRARRCGSSQLKAWALTKVDWVATSVSMLPEVSMMNSTLALALLASGSLKNNSASSARAVPVRTRNATLARRDFCSPFRSRGLLIAAFPDCASGSARLPDAWPDAGPDAVRAHPARRVLRAGSGVRSRRKPGYPDCWRRGPECRQNRGLTRWLARAGAAEPARCRVDPQDDRAAAGAGAHGETAFRGGRQLHLAAVQFIGLLDRAQGWLRPAASRVRSAWRVPTG